MGSTARKTHNPVVHQISKTINYNDTQAATGIKVGTLPAGAVAHITRQFNPLAWNGTTSVALNVGTTPTGNQLLSGIDIRTAANRTDTVVPIASAGPFAADVDIYASIAFGGTIGSQGSVTVVVEFTPEIG